MGKDRKQIVLLVISQEEPFLHLVKEHFGRPFKLLLSRSPQEALILLSHQAIHAILSDQTLNQMSGINLCKQLKLQKKFRFLTFILMIEREEEVLIKEALEAGVSQCILKPIDYSACRAALMSSLHYNQQLYELNQQLNRIKQLAERDPLTNFYNRYALYELGKREIAKAERSHLPLSILMIDIDRFKAINDAMGHLVGDEVLIEFASLLTHSLRSYDITIRFGGEEFIILLPNTTTSQALVVAEKIRLTIASHVFRTNHGEARLTVSIGATTLSQTPKKLEDLLEDIDKALYCAKKAGRNQVVLFEIPRIRLS